MASEAHSLEELQRTLDELRVSAPLVRLGGRVVELTRTSYRISGLDAQVRLGDLLDVRGCGHSQLAQVIKIDASGVLTKPFDSTAPFGVGATAWLRGSYEICPHASWKGRVIDALASPIDNAGALVKGSSPMFPDNPPPQALERGRIEKPLTTGVRVLDLFTPFCFGQRMGIFAGSGVGKSTLLAMCARPKKFDTVVVALVGERGREVREFLEGMEPETRERTVAVVSTGDQSPMMRRLAPQTATTVAEYFRDRGENVLLVVDSITRYAHAAREVALAAGEPPVARGYPPSVFSDLPRLLERSGYGSRGTGCITALYAVLVDGDDHNDPVADSMRGTLDGHIVLDRRIAEQGRYPAVNPLVSISRLSHLVWTPEQSNLVMKLREMMALFEDTRDIRLLGGYKQGADAVLDRAIGLVPKIIDALKQTPKDAFSNNAFEELRNVLVS